MRTKFDRFLNSIPKAAATRWMLRALCASFVLLGGVGFARQSVVIVKGIGGEQSFDESIEATAQIWDRAARSAGHGVFLVDGEKQPGGVSQIDQLRAALLDAGKPAEDASSVLWLVLIGHGSAQGRSAKFAMDGPDLSVDGLASLLETVRCPVIVVAGFSCAGAFVKPLSGPDRLIVAATRSGEEENWTRFSRCFAEALTGTAADADADGQVSLFEAWRHAVGQVESLYKEQGRMLTEHAVLEDTGDGRPIGADAFNSASKPEEKKTRKDSPLEEDGTNAHKWHLLPNPVEAALTEGERAQREEIERSVKTLREAKTRRLPEDYQAEMEGLLLKLAAIYARAQSRLPR